MIKTCIRQQASKPSRGKGFIEHISLLEKTSQGWQWWMVCFHIRESFLSFVCGLNLGDVWDTQFIFPVEMYRKVSVSTKDRSKRKPLKSWQPISSLESRKN